MITTKPITEQVLQNALQYRFRDEVCGLNNAYVYYNESDYLSISNKGFATEIEIKISRSDFKADFKKPKHMQYAAFKLGLTHWLKRDDEEYKTCPLGFFKIPKYHANRVARNPDNYFKVGDDFYRYEKYSGYKNSYWNTRIYFHPVNLPNKFYYLVPEGLITKDEVPEYAGLMYYKPHEERLVNRVEIIKRAPIVHREKFTMWQSIAVKLSHRIKSIHCDPQLKAI